MRSRRGSIAEHGLTIGLNPSADPIARHHQALPWRNIRALGDICDAVAVVGARCSAERETRHRGFREGPRQYRARIWISSQPLKSRATPEASPRAPASANADEAIPLRVGKS